MRGAACLLVLSCGVGCSDAGGGAPDARPDGAPRPPDEDSAYLVVGGSYGVAVSRYRENGKLEARYGDRGVASIELARYPSAAVGDAAGAVLVAAESVDTREPMTLRLTCDGQLDPAFARRRYAGRVDGIVRRADGGAVLATESYWEETGFLLGLLPDGTADPTFGTDGIATNAAARYGGLVRGPGENLISVGRTDWDSTTLVAQRWTATGEIDPAFGVGGRAVIDVGGAGVRGGNALATDDRRIFVGTRRDNDAAVLVALHHDGSVDPSFGGGVVTFALPYPSEWTAVATTTYGGVVVAGWGTEPTDPYPHPLVARYTPGGELDPSFGHGAGFVWISPVEGGSGGLVVERDGRIVVGVSGALLRLLAYGALDPTFGDGGVVLVEHGLGALVRTAGTWCEALPGSTRR